ncbi:uncharacterized protein LOC114238457 isoform X2 [Balaenoptera acutorostrata]|uniref:Uncharacterized protein LOC114238457 isoform X2 n=1 Tax=Balaenoptera acutorostrata TaxID=9767 RepID=A0ABM3S633_BALAC|nr:uncharacterized protein LOC114238457 isoform X2 [Balaenoptera acutorostrata]
MDSVRRSDLAEVTQPVGGVARGFSLASAAPQDLAHDEDPSQAGSGGNSRHFYSVTAGKPSGQGLKRRAGVHRREKGSEARRRVLGLGGRRSSGALIPLTTARSSGRLLGGAAAAADWSKQGAESVNCPRPRGRRSLSKDFS